MYYRNLDVSISPLPGSRISDVSSDVIKIAKALDYTMHFTFNGVQLTATPNTTVVELVEAYYQELSQE